MSSITDMAVILNLIYDLLSKQRMEQNIEIKFYF